MSTTQVLICGAGPTGLAAAAVLRKFGVDVRVIDKNETRSDKSKALGVQAGTLECLTSAFRGELTANMVAAGQLAEAAWIHIEGAEPVRVNLRQIPSRFNFILILAQSETEKFLEEELGRWGGKVERRMEWLGCEVQPDRVVSKVRGPSGAVEDISSEYLIACDGAHSAVRHALNLPFEGGAYEGNFVLGDVKLDWPFPENPEVRIFTSERGSIACFPLPNGVRRVVLVPKKMGTPKALDISHQEFQSLIDQLSPYKMKVTAATWLTRFHIHHRMVERFQKERVFLAGDAAHIHSPIGGQGMNTGIQDALNLGHKLAAVLRHHLTSVVLKNYERERMPVARSILRGTDLAFRSALLSENPLVDWSRRHVLPFLARREWIQRRILRSVSEVTISRQEIARYTRLESTRASESHRA